MSIRTPPQRFPNLYVRSVALALAAALLLSPRQSTSHPTPVASAPPSPAADARVRKLIDDFYDEFPTYYPTEATVLGLHQLDGELEDLSASGIAKELGWLKSWQGRFTAVNGSPLSADSRFDLELVLQSLRERLFDRERLQSHRRRPNLYVRLCSRSVNAIIKRDYQTADRRLRSLVQRLDKIPSLLQSAVANLDLMSPVAIELTLRDLDATVRFFQNDVVAAFAAVGDPARVAELKRSANSAAVAIQRYGDFLRRDGIPKASATYVLGAQLFAEKLWADEMIDTPLPELLLRGETELKRLQEEFRATARRIDPTKSAAAVQLEILKDHPAASALLDETQKRLAGQRRFLVEHDLVTVPSEVLPQVRETPPFLRATSLASMDTPGPFEASSEAYYYITLPDKTQSAAEIEDFLRGAYNRPLIDVVSIHEAYPGHYVQYLWLSRLSKARQFNGVSSNSEGWAHYAEQLMLDQGYGSDDPRLRLAQLQDALLRAARFVVGIRMHTQGMTLAQSIDFFQRQGFQSQQVAELETRRGTQDPLYLVYTYGKLEITKLRQAYQQKLGPAYTLHRFHDDFLRYGRAPLKLVAAAMLSAS